MTVQFVNAMADQIAPWVDRVVAGAVQVLERKGLLVPYPELRDHLATAPGLTMQGDRVCFAPDHTTTFLARYRACHPFNPPTEYRLFSGGHGHHIVDFDGTVRPLTLADIERGARLAASLEPWGMRGPAPGLPQDVPGPLQSLALLVANAKNQPGRPGHMSGHSPEGDRYIQEMLEVLGYDAGGAGIHLVSPLRFEGQEIETALERIRQDPDIPVSVGTMVILGVSSPASVLSGFVTATAEVVGGGLILAALGVPADRMHIWANAYPFDMRAGCFTYGTPANLTCTLLEREVSRWLGTEVVAKSFSCMAQTPGPHACAQKAGFTGLMATLGKKLFSGAGVLSVDEVYSPVQLIYDREIFGYMKRTVQMVPDAFSEELLMTEEIIANTSDSFLDSDSTARHFRQLQWDSEIFPSRMIGQWEAAGCPMAHDAAEAEIERLLAGYEYELDPAKSSTLDALYVRAQAELLG